MVIQQKLSQEKVTSGGFWRVKNRMMNSKFCLVISLPETNSSHLKMDGWNTRFLLGRPIFRCYVSFREGSLQ